MRDRLVELLCNVKCEGEECFGNCPHRIGQKCNKVQRLEMCSVFAIADHLLAEGVIVPPCKVGDRIYYIDSTNFIDCEVVKQISINYHGKWVVLLDHSLINFDEIGKTVFLAREEAEKALAERSDK